MKALGSGASDEGWGRRIYGERHEGEEGWAKIWVIMTGHRFETTKSHRNELFEYALF